MGMSTSSWSSPHKLGRHPRNRCWYRKSPLWQQHPPTSTSSNGSGPNCCATNGPSLRQCKRDVHLRGRIHRRRWVAPCPLRPMVGRKVVSIARQSTQRISGQRRRIQERSRKSQRWLARSKSRIARSEWDPSCCATNGPSLRHYKRGDRCRGCTRNRPKSRWRAAAAKSEQLRRRLLEYPLKTIWILKRLTFHDAEMQFSTVTSIKQ
jgi:hypothetical protein